MCAIACILSYVRLEFLDYFSADGKQTTKWDARTDERFNKTHRGVCSQCKSTKCANIIYISVGKDIWFPTEFKIILKLARYQIGCALRASVQRHLMKTVALLFCHLLIHCGFGFVFRRRFFLSLSSSNENSKLNVRNCKINESRAYDWISVNLFVGNIFPFSFKSNWLKILLNQLPVCFKSLVEIFKTFYFPSHFFAIFSSTWFRFWEQS